MDTIAYKDFTITIEQEESPMNPFTDWDGNVKLALFHKRYNLHNDTDLDPRDYDGWESLKKALVQEYRPLAILPVYMYDHSGQTIRTTPFSCRWDSGQIGFVFINKEVLHSWGYKSRKGYEKATGKTLEQELEGGVRLYDDYITGNVWGYEVVSSEGEVLDSCGGFYGDEGKEDAVESAKAFIDAEIREVNQIS